MGVSGISGSGDLAAARKQMTERIFKKMDSDGNGSISKDELQKAADDRKAATGKHAPTNLPSVDDFFQSADADADGGISQDELLAQLSKMGPPQGKHDGTQESGGAGSSGGASLSGGCGGSSSAAAPDKAGSSSSSSNSSKDPADANGDGKVSAAERSAYDYKQLMTSLANLLQDTVSAATGQDSPAAESSPGRSVVV